jgi:hypothetical protein
MESGSRQRRFVDERCVGSEVGGDFGDLNSGASCEFTNQNNKQYTNGIRA